MEMAERAFGAQIERALGAQDSANWSSPGVAQILDTVKKKYQIVNILV